MHLNGIMARPGTIIGIHARDQRFLAADVPDSDDAEDPSTPLRWATAEEVTQDAIGAHAPRSVTEHEGMRLTQTVYGKGRIIGLGSSQVAVEFPVPSRAAVRKQLNKVLSQHGLRKRKGGF